MWDIDTLPSLEQNDYQIAENGRDIKLGEKVRRKWTNKTYVVTGRSGHMVTLKGGNSDDIVSLNINEAVRKYK